MGCISSGTELLMLLRLELEEYRHSREMNISPFTFYLACRPLESRAYSEDMLLTRDY
jgi:hypothetical protein